MPTQWTAAMAAALPDDGTRYEVLDGELAMTPAPSWDHQRLTLALRDVLTLFLRAHAIGKALVAPADVEFSSHRPLEPDVFVVLGARQRDRGRGRTLTPPDSCSPSRSCRRRPLAATAGPGDGSAWTNRSTST